MSYENSIACQMIATECACCGRPLVDARSVETGMGPHCRAKHGFNAADVDVDLLMVASVLASVLSPEHYATMIDGVSSAREAANKLVYHIACVGLGAEVGQMIEALNVLGFKKLSAILTKRGAPIRIERVGGKIEVEAPFSEEFTALARHIPSRRWVKYQGRKGGKNVFDADFAGRVHKALVRAYPGMTAHGPKGFFRLQESA